MRKVRIVTRLESDLAKILKADAAKNRRSVSQHIAYLLALQGSDIKKLKSIKSKGTHDANVSGNPDKEDNSAGK